MRGVEGGARSGGGPAAALSGSPARCVAVERFELGFDRLGDRPFGGLSHAGDAL